jgi:hypothetical protein
MEGRLTDFSGFHAAYRDQCLRAVLASTGDRHAEIWLVSDGGG